VRGVQACVASGHEVVVVGMLQSLNHASA
jgi:hypothetical protein